MSNSARSVSDPPTASTAARPEAPATGSRPFVALATSSAELVSLLKGLITIPLLTRLLPPAEFAAYGQALALVGLAMPTITLTSYAAVLRFLPGAGPEQQRAWYTAWCIVLAVAGALATGLVVGQAQGIGAVMIGPDRRAATFIASSTLLIWSGLAQLAVVIWFRATGQLQMFNRITMAQAGCTVVALVTATALGLDGVGLIGMVALADVCALAVCARRLREDRPWRWPDFSRLPAFARYALVGLPAAYTAWCVTFIDRLIVVHFVGLAEAGFVALGAALAMALIRIIATPVYLQVNHHAVLAADNGDRRQLSGIYEQAMVAIVVLCVPLVVGSMTIAPELIRVIAAGSYAPAAPLLPIFLLACSLQVACNVNETYLQIARRAHAPLVAATLVLVALVALNLLLVPVLSFVGAAVATVGGYLVSCVYGACAAGEARAWRNVAGPAWRAMLAAMVMLAACLLAKHLAGGADIARLAAAGVTGFAVYVALAFVPVIGLLACAPVAALAEPVLSGLGLRSAGKAGP